VVGIYKSGDNLTYLAAVLDDDSISLTEVMDGFTLLSAIAEQDADILADIEELEQTIVSQRQELQAERSRVATLEEAQAAMTAELHAADKECKTALQEVEAARSAKKAVLAWVEKDKAKWAKQEDQLQADSARVAALLKSSSSSSSRFLPLISILPF